MARSARGIVDAYTLGGQHGLWRQAERVLAPTLLVYGGRDQLVSFRMARQGGRGVPRFAAADAAGGGSCGDDGVPGDGRAGRPGAARRVTDGPGGVEAGEELRSTPRPGQPEDTGRRGPERRALRGVGSTAHGAARRTGPRQPRRCSPAGGGGGAPRARPRPAGGRGGLRGGPRSGTPRRAPGRAPRSPATPGSPDIRAPGLGRPAERSAPPPGRAAAPRRTPRRAAGGAPGGPRSAEAHRAAVRAGRFPGRGVPRGLRRPADAPELRPPTARTGCAAGAAGTVPPPSRTRSGAGNDDDGEHAADGLVTAPAADGDRDDGDDARGAPRAARAGRSPASRPPR